MPYVLAHRGNTHGPSFADENQLATVARALSRGCGVEIDIRRTSYGRFYISHDLIAEPQDPPADDYFAEIRRHPEAVVALNVKEEGYEADLVALLARHGVLRQVFLFDMELIEAVPGRMARRFRALDPAVRIAARVSDRGESIDRALGIPEASVIWLDEFERPWATKADVQRLLAAGKSVYAVSPDLHRFPYNQALSRWLDFLHWGVHGICTDYAAELQQIVTDRAAARRHIA